MFSGGEGGGGKMLKLRIDRRITESEVRFCMKQLVITLKKIKRILNINLLVSEFIYEKKSKYIWKHFDDV